MFYRYILIVVVISYNIFGNDLKNIKMFEANFKQEIINDSNNTIVYTGKIYIKEPNFILWKYKKPIIKNVYFNKNRVFIDEPILEQVIITDINQDINIIKLLKKSKKISNDMYKGSVEGINFKIIMNKEKINSINYKDKMYNNIFITFTNIVQNHRIDDEIFIFNIPLNYDIIRK
jgi:outer membrane lipoprotein carrier protein